MASGSDSIKLLILVYGSAAERKARGWSDPDRLTAQLIEDLQYASYGHAVHEVVAHIERPNPPPRLVDGKGDYPAILAQNDLAGRVARGEIDEVWMWGDPWAGWWEVENCGAGAFYANGGTLPGLEPQWFAMGFNYERGIPEALHSYAHRAEWCVAHAFDTDVPYAVPQPPPANDWHAFSRFDRQTPGAAGCGNCHFPPNGVRDYDYSNRTPVRSSADAWEHFPDLTGTSTLKNCSAWGGDPEGDQHGYLMWWFRHMPHHPGRHNNVSTNWWNYILHPTRPAS